ncbi:kinase-like protein [Pholiota conissans]|uniref:Kinase-like protein n=1 Tax=Pholiota conissans TaxID=109636 RepID=A0A9P5YY85_9AGAR|nr:kinase-like protein [Pholiota conissans]
MSLERQEPIDPNDKPAEGNSGQDFMDKVWGLLEPWWHTQPRFAILETKPEEPFCYGDSQCLIKRKCDPAAAFITDKSNSDESRVLVNGKKLKYGEETMIHDGCEITFGPHGHFIFRDISKPTAEQSIPPPLPSPSPNETPINSSITPTLAALFTADMSLRKGSFSTVVRARHNSTGNVYALKTIHPETNYIKFELSGLNPSVLTRSSAQADSDHTDPSGTDVFVPVAVMMAYAEIFGSFFDEGSGVHTLLLEYVSGGDLFNYVERYENGMPEADAKQIVYQICSGMTYVHGRGIMHRDLKPHNILLTQDTPPRVKIAGFGLSKRMDKYHTSNTNRREVICGTPDYAAPEILTEQYDHLVDSFSLGVIIHEMLTGQVPYVRQERVGMVREGDGDRNEDTEGEKEHKKDESNEKVVHIFVRLVQERVLDLKYLDERNLSDDARSIITALLANAPEERLSISNALQNSWFHDLNSVNSHHSPDAPRYGDTGTSAIDSRQATQIPELALDSAGAQAQGRDDSRHMFPGPEGSGGGMDKKWKSKIHKFVRVWSYQWKRFRRMWGELGRR